MTKAKRKIKPYKRFTESEIQFLRDNYKTMAIKEMARELDRSPFGVKNRLRILGLEQPQSLVDERIKNARFRKGHKPWNAGMKGLVIPGSEKTQFKKGNTPPQTKYDGCISIRHNHKERGEPPYKWIRISKAKWVPYHRYLWEKEYGKIPKGSVITFRNGDTLDVRLENLELITKAENAVRNANFEKMAETNRKVRRAFKDLENDGFIAKLITRDEEAQKEILENHPELIELKRKQLKLNRKIKYATDKQT